MASSMAFCTAKTKQTKSQMLDFILQKSSIKDAELGLFIQFILFQDFTNLKCLVKDYNDLPLQPSQGFVGYHLVR